MQDEVNFILSPMIIQNSHLQECNQVLNNVS